VCIEQAGVIFCQLGTIGEGETAGVDVRVGTDGSDPASGRTSVSAQGVTPQVIDEPYISKIGNPPVAGPGTEVTYTIRVINPTDAAVSNLRVRDTMPDPIEIISFSADSGTLRVQGQQVIFTQSSLEPGGRITITLQTRVREGGFNEIINEACLTSSDNDTPSCAQMSFLRASTIPATGETPLWRSIMLALAGVALMVAACGGFLIWRRRT
jgi:uncharacterized repeat protein (TIGR01451 family)